MYLRTLIVAVLFCSLTVGLAQADTYDPSGEWWLGSIGAEIATTQPYSMSGELSAVADTWTIATTDSDGTSETTTLTSVTTHFDPQSWLVINATEDGSAWTQLVAANDHIIHQVDRDSGDGDLDQITFIRKDTTLTDPDVVGEYALFGHWLDIPAPAAYVETGIVTLNPNHTFTANFQGSDGGSGTDSGTWSLDAPNSQLIIDPAGDDGPFPIEIGQGGLAMTFDIDGDDDLGFNFLVKKIAAQPGEPGLTTVRTLAEAVGHYLIQGFYTDEQGDPWTIWGSADLYSDGTYAVNITGNDGPPIPPITGTFTMDPDGTVHCTDDITEITRDGVISLDSDLIVLADMHFEFPPQQPLEPGQDVTEDPTQVLSVLYMIKPAPEPATLALFVLGFIPLLQSGARRRSTKRTHG